ncbi:MAG TPA: hypothetical protein VGV37_15585 [Aliidongia sp.]|uniref:hypothetical protein n=1 Tax=Aliidongia sp. TaxID=1914230 RepID=UPI002DDC8FDC|nr:hypothetical protein [Aliidongia sp.]HEV2675943.1 hypothetical protein [Aliidongia sp.]
MPELPVAEARDIHRSNPNFFRGVIDFGQDDHTVQAALAGSIFKKFANQQFVNCFDFAFNNHHSTSQTKQRMIEWGQRNAFIQLPAGHQAGHIDVWGDGDDSLAHACRLIDVMNPRTDDVWASAMGAGQAIVSHYRRSFAGGAYGAQIVSFVNFANWNAGWMQQGNNFVGDIARWAR